MATYTEVGVEVTLAGTTATDVFASPASGERHNVRFAKVYNRDTVAHDFTIRHQKGATNRDMVVEDVGPGEWFEIGEEDRYVLDATDEKIQMFTDATATTTEPCVIGSYEKVAA